MTHILESLGMARSLSEYSLDQMLAQETQYFARGTTVILITSAPDSTWVARAKRLSQRGVKAMCVYLDPMTFNPLIRAEDVRRALRASGIPTIVIRCGEDLSHALGQKSQ
jgi:23S rRNA U2552 (ribose-2'-O)-methylase RlmE/FtsJ